MAAPYMQVLAKYYEKHGEEENFIAQTGAIEALSQAKPAIAIHRYIFGKSQGPNRQIEFYTDGRQDLFAKIFRIEDDGPREIAHLSAKQVRVLSENSGEFTAFSEIKDPQWKQRIYKQLGQGCSFDILYKPRIVISPMVRTEESGQNPEQPRMGSLLDQDHKEQIEAVCVSLL